MLISELLLRLREYARMRIRNGSFTERGFAPRAGLSQPHLHNVLKGERMMTPEVADQILTALGLSVEDIMQLDPPRKAPVSQIHEARQGVRSTSR